jgi:OHCU decarboxylase
MLEARPFHSIEALLDASDGIGDGLGQEDWLEAFHAHPRIGERKAERAQGATEQQWSREEQSGMDAGTASEGAEIARAMAEGNARYHERFGHIFIVCATGKRAREMLDLLRVRLENPPAEELRIAAAEQRRITRLRLTKLLST